MNQKELETAILSLLCELGKKHGAENAMKAAKAATQMVEPLMALKGTGSEDLAFVALDVFNRIMETAWKAVKEDETDTHTDQGDRSGVPAAM